ncbi:MAG: hypothetical protein ACJ779_01025 [Chloroflexota bacterium]
MLRRFFPTPTDDAPDASDATPSAGAADGGARSAPRPGEPSFTALPIAGFTRRRMAILVGAVLVTWILFVFARQVSEAAAATTKAQAMIDSNAQRRDQVAGLEREVERIGDRRFVLQQARGYGLGGPHEIAFSLEAAAPSLSPDSPGSASVRLGAASSGTPLEHWLTLLFGPGS